MFDLESSSSRKELLTALFESSVINTLMLDITCETEVAKDKITPVDQIIALHNKCSIAGYMISAENNSSDIFCAKTWISGHRYMVPPILTSHDMRQHGNSIE